MKVGIMKDIESLDLGPKSVVTQLAFVAFDMDDPEDQFRVVSEYLPIQPQIFLGRTINADTVIWWMNQSEEARAGFKQNTGNDMDELTSLVNSFNRKLSQVIEGADDYEIWARGPQFDIVNIETLFGDCGEQVPWKYDRVRDLRTLMKLAGVATADVIRPADQIDHVALDDCRYQILCYQQAMRKLHAG